MCHMISYVVIAIHKRSLFLLVLAVLTFTFFNVTSWADNSTAPGIVRDVTDADEIEKERAVLPFAFYSEAFDFTFGIAGGTSGYQSGQMGLFGAAITSTNNTSALYLLGTDIQMPSFRKRLFVDPYLTIGWYAKQRDYLSGNPDFPDERAGSNDSSADNFVVDAGWDNRLELRFKYILPMGHARETAISEYILDRGILVSGATGGDVWNPLKSGLTFLQVKPFYFYRTFDFEVIETRNDTNGTEFAIVYDNRDFPKNPSKGSTQRIKIGNDFGWFNSGNSWTVIQGEFGKYYSLGETKHSRQRVIALDLWASDNVSMQKKTTTSGIVFSHRAPPSFGSSLGGFYRLRAYPSNRFHDKVAIYYGAEYRVIPDWQPLRHVKVLKFFEIDWWQIVGILEAGRVDRSWTGKTFYNDLHWDAGIGIRLMMKKVVVRLDTAFSEEGWTMWAMAGQSF